MPDVRPHSRLEPVLERMSRRPTQLVAQLCRVHGVTPIVSQPVFDELNQGLWLAERSEQSLDDGEVRPFGVSPDVIHLAHSASSDLPARLLECGPKTSTIKDVVPEDQGRSIITHKRAPDDEGL